MTACRSLLPLVFCALTLPAFGGDVYVNNRTGHDMLDGRSDRPVSALHGPVRTVQRALKLARPSDRIHLANTGAPYYGPLSLTGPQHSGYPGLPFGIDGNGAVISGARPVPPEAWQPVDSRVWVFEPLRKGYFQLLRDGQVLPEVQVDSTADALPELPEGHWCAWQGRIYCALDLRARPSEFDFAFAFEPVGLTLYQVEHVVVRNVTLQHFRIDGVNAHDLCKNVHFENVTSVENGRSGLTVAGSSDVTIHQGRLEGNRLYQLLLTELGQANLDDAYLSAPPVVE